VAISGTKNKRNRTDLIRKLEHLLMQAEMELKWESMPATLRRNDPSVTIFSDEKHDVTVANAQFHSLGSALHFNTTVTELRLSVSFQVTGTTIRSDNWEPLLHYIETSVVLQIVSLDEISYDRSNRDPICVNFTEHLLRAVGRNANIHALKFGNFVVYEPLSMAAFLKATTSVQVLELNISCFRLPNDSRLMHAGALASNAHVTDLTLYFEVNKDNDVCASAMRVVRNNKTIQQLKLEFEDDDDDDVDPCSLVPGHVWSSLLQSGIPLRSLDFRSVRFDRDAMTHLLRGLSNRDTAIDLLLEHCFFENCVIDALVL
jgi:hypothetical protein